MVMQKRWFIRKETDLKEFGKALKACKEFNPKKQKDLLKMIMNLKLDKMVIPGVKKRRIRKKHLKKAIENMKSDLTFKMLNMMIEEVRDVPEHITRQDGIDAFDAVIKFSEEE